MKTFTLHLIRHGLTQSNADGIYMGGGLDLPLSEAGVDALREMARRFAYPRVGTVFSSPMRRALQSAELLFPAAGEHNILEDLRECRFGAFEGQRVDELVKNPDFARWLDPQSGFVPEGGESGSAFAQRCVRGVHNMFRYLMRSGISEAACLTHGGVIMTVMAQLALPKKPPTQWRADNGAGYSVRTSAAMLMRDNLLEAVEIVPKGYLDEMRNGQ